MLSQTLKKFGYPNSLIKEYGNWLLLCRYKQTTLGSLILICKEEVDAFSKISDQSFSELSKIIREVEEKVKAEFNFEKINYLMLMMHDPEVHFHIIPRYAQDKNFEGVIFKDFGYPNKPDLSVNNEVSEEVFNKLVEKLKKLFND